MTAKWNYYLVTPLGRTLLPADTLLEAELEGEKLRKQLGLSDLVILQEPLKNQQAQEEARRDEKGGSMKPGDKVRITAPAFKGVEGEVFTVLVPEEVPTIGVKVLSGPFEGLGLMFRARDLEAKDGD